jgi:hypothetical protein
MLLFVLFLILFTLSLSYPFLNNRNFPFPCSPQFMNQDRSVSTVTRLLTRRPRSPGLIPSNGKWFISPPHRPNQLWGPPSGLFNVHRWLLSWW